ncbi:terminase small subunit [Rhodoferax sediminis]|uniref:Terminase small subunit n=2 Tax=Rhodoferax sediminis TaxID=2509614 RepID=A0A515DFX7_9BURK|nr:terminase small subunit [Rhodoferax sediminis]
MAAKPTGKKSIPPKPRPQKAPALAPRHKAAGVATSSPKVPMKRTAINEDGDPARHVLTLKPKQQKFVDEYMIDLNGTQAAIRAGYRANSAAELAYEYLRKPQIQSAIAAARKAQQERTQIDADRVMLEAWHIMIADARDLVQVKVGCCRYCWGEGHKLQRTLSEFNNEREKHLNSGKPIEDWDEQGGIGYNPIKAPHTGCPECHGDGQARVVLGDTRTLSARALALYAGARQGKYGIEVLMHSKMDALEKLARHLGLYERDNQQKTDPLATLLHAIAKGNGNGFSPVALDPERRAALAASSAFTAREYAPGEGD